MLLKRKKKQSCCLRRGRTTRQLPAIADCGHIPDIDDPPKLHMWSLENLARRRLLLILDRTSQPGRDSPIKRASLLPLPPRPTGEPCLGIIHDAIIREERNLDHLQVPNGHKCHLCRPSRAFLYGSSLAPDAPIEIKKAKGVNNWPFLDEEKKAEWWRIGQERRSEKMREEAQGIKCKNYYRY